MVEQLRLLAAARRLSVPLQLSMAVYHSIPSVINKDMSPSTANALIIFMMIIEFIDNGHFRSNGRTRQVRHLAGQTSTTVQEISSVVNDTCE